MQLTDEEVSIVEDFRRKTAVVKAFNEGIDTAREITRQFLSTTTVNASDLDQLLQDARRPEKKHG